MTTLELSERIALAARKANGLGAAVQAVIATLHESESWFVRTLEDDAGNTIDIPYEQTSFTQSTRRPQIRNATPGGYNTKRGNR